MRTRRPRTSSTTSGRASGWSTAGTITHRYPECWRCHTPLIFRISDDWFISVDEIREPMREANRSVEWTPEYMGKRMDDWLVNMSDWNISRRRYYGLPLPFYPCACGHLTVIGSRAQLAELATGPLDALEELRRPWIDDVTIRCPQCGGEVRRITEVGDVWLDAGIVPFSTLGWENPEWIEQGYATGAAKGLTTADLPDHAFWEEWFPAEWVSEMREQIRLWFYSQLFMSVALTGRAPYRKVLGYEKMLDETGRAMHGSWGNMISAEDAFARMGADVMRWQYCAQPPSQNLLFGFGPGQEIQRKLLTLWNSTSFLIQYANIAGFTPSLADLADGPSGDLTALDRWLLARTRRMVEEVTEAYEQYLTVNALRAFEAFVDDLSNWYVRRSRRRFWDGDEAALRTLWTALVDALRVVSPIMPFLTEHLWQILVVPVVPEAPRSIFLAGWPSMNPADDDLLEEVATVRRLVELGRQARAASRLRTRQPLRRLVAEGLDHAAPHLDEIADELRVKEVVLGPVEATELRVRPNLPVLGPRLGPELGKLRAALAAGEFEALEDGRFRVAGHDLGPDEVLVERTEKEGWAVAASDGATVALDVELDDELRLEGRVYDAHPPREQPAQGAGPRPRPTASDLRLPASDADLLQHADWLARETLAVSVGLAEGDDGRGADQPDVSGLRRSRTVSRAAAATLHPMDSRMSTSPPSPKRPTTSSPVATSTSTRLAATVTTCPRARSSAAPAEPRTVRLCARFEERPDVALLARPQRRLVGHRLAQLGEVGVIVRRRAPPAGRWSPCSDPRRPAPRPRRRAMQAGAGGARRAPPAARRAATPARAARRRGGRQRRAPRPAWRSGARTMAAGAGVPTATSLTGGAAAACSAAGSSSRRWSSRVA